MLNERNQTQNTKYCMISLYDIPEKQPAEKDNRLVARG